MAKKIAAKTGKALVIVESPAKAKTIGKYLGSGFLVEASIGHVRDLPQGAKEMPEEFKGEPWAYLGVNVHQDFTPVYVVPASKRKQVTKLRSALKDARELFLATDEDREGEAISWHLVELLRPKVPVCRLVFHEITREAITEALEHTRPIDDGLVRAQETRRILDRLFGYEVSPLLWRKLRPRLSAGRVQSVAVRLIVERERDRRAFHRASYWDLLGTFRTSEDKTFQAALVSCHGRRIPSGKDFDPATGRLKDPQLLQLDERGARTLAAELQGVTYHVTALEEKPFQRRPGPPFTTSTLQQEANRKLGFTARQTMSVAQSLYENGHITYMRTDSTQLAQVAVDAARDLVLAQYGPEYLPDSPPVYKAKVKNAQEAHEAIRPAGHPFELPESLRAQLSRDEFRLFELVWKRTVASQMQPARGRTITITVEGGGATWQVSGSTIDFPGFLRAYVEGSDDPEAELADKETLLPTVRQGDRVGLLGIEPKEHSTQPPARFTEASLTKALEERGIGRPSTYAAIIDTILHRDYVFKRGTALVPTWLAFSVAKLLEDHLPRLVDYQFTAQLEDDLDSISRGEAAHLDYLHRFYFGNGHPGLKKQLENKVEEIRPQEVNRFLIGTPSEGASHQEPIFLRVGRYGPFLEQGERRASIREDMPPDELTMEVALELLDKSAQGEQPLGYCPETERPVYLKEGRFGPYVQIGAADDQEKPKNASLLKGMSAQDITLDVALRLLALPRTLGTHPESNEPVVAHNGRFGPYVKCGVETRSLTGISPLEVTLGEALDLLAQPKARRGARRTPEPLKELGTSPVTGEPVKLLDGRYGPYVTDGQTNASLPRGVSVDSATLPDALGWLAERAAAGPPRKKAARRGGTKPAKPAAKPAAKKVAKSVAPKQTPAKGTKRSAPKRKGVKKAKEQV